MSWSGMMVNTFCEWVPGEALGSPSRRIVLAQRNQQMGFASLHQWSLQNCHPRSDLSIPACLQGNYAASARLWHPVSPPSFAGYASGNATGNVARWYQLLALGSCRRVGLDMLQEMRPEMLQDGTNYLRWDRAAEW
eukprot:CAMPEP_0172786954 /NCGR_PEP_ID=MMETSP1074-20121228/206208_1 /TAXON_ID=2916 /ORGANISM="Ceratium fusus, Strain PA161109" /LENGTH=135 /DNA_ID=CAMNT_0013623973 /DNA_START=308 /DNA_END=713 /DNA_ORIENTATION=-